MNRRTFLRVLGSTLAVGAAVSAGVIPIPAHEPQKFSFWANQMTTPTDGLTYSMMREAFDRCSRADGGELPQYIITTQEIADQYLSLARQCGLVFDADL